jgi:carboxymethylenebutenolidase
VQFAANGGTCDGYLATPAAGGKRPAVVVIQEWWGLVGHIKDVAERFASEGFVALAPDLYHGKQAAEPDEAGKLMMSLQAQEVVKDLDGAVAYLLGNERVAGERVGGRLLPRWRALALRSLPQSIKDWRLRRLLRRAPRLAA